VQRQLPSPDQNANIDCMEMHAPLRLFTLFHGRRAASAHCHEFLPCFLFPIRSTHRCPIGCVMHITYALHCAARWPANRGAANTDPWLSSEGSLEQERYGDLGTRAGTRI
jgi:hypothetical protein